MCQNKRLLTKKINLANNGELAVQYSGKKNIKISKEEYAILKEQIMKQNNIYKRNSEAIDYAFTAENFYVYENYGNDKFKVVKKLNIEKNRELVNAIRKELKNESTIRDAKEFNSMLKILKNGRRSNNRNSVNAENGRPDSRNGGISGREPQSNTKRDSGSSSSDNGTGVKYSIKQTPATQKQIDEMDTEDLLKKTGQQIKTTLPRGNKSLKDTILEGRDAVKDFINNRNEYKLTLQMQLTNSFAGVENELKAKIEQ